MSLSDNDNDDKIDIFTLKRESTLLPTNNYSEKSERLKSKILILSYYSKDINY